MIFSEDQMKRLLLSLLFAVFAFSTSSQTKVLFDATKHEMAGNADWVIDADAWNNNMPAYPCTGSTNESNPQRYPTPDQSGITQATPETYWTGGISAWAVDIVKTWGWTVESLPPGASITYGDGGNAQDLSNYDVFIICEPQNQFTTAEKNAIIAFVQNGGGLFMVADHETSDRDCDGWDSPWVYNDLTGATSASSTGLFGIWFRVDGLEVKGEDWFDDGTDNNVNTDTSDPIIFGPAGSGTGGLGLFGSTSMDINPADNPTVAAHVWRTGQAHNNLRVTFATASYGLGRVAAIGDSSPADDDTGDSGDSLYPGWDKASGGVNNREIHLNATYWLANPEPDLTAPIITEGPSAEERDCSAEISWTTDEGATSFVEYGPTASYGTTVSVTGYTQNHLVTLSGLTPSTEYHFRVYSSDTSANGPTYSSDGTFTTTAGTAPVITSGPTVTSLSGTTAKIEWQTDELSSSEVQYGTTGSYGGDASGAGSTKNHSVTLTGLTPETTYHYMVLSTDLCSNGPTCSSDATFTTGSPALDLSGWTIKQYNASFTYTFPAGTTIPQNGYLILARNVTEAEFRAAWPSMPSEAVFVNSNQTGSCSDGCMPLINGAETFELYDASSALLDGITIAMASGNAYQRNNPGDAPGSASSWTTVAQGSANPGSGAGSLSGAGVVINEMADAATFTYEFIELFYDGGSFIPDTTAPERITNLKATPLSTTSIKLEWTAPGDDGMTGTASSYEIRMSTTPIRNETEFASATIVSPPSPIAGGTSQFFTVSSLSPDTVYFFAMKTSDEVPNTSAMSNTAWALTQEVGSGTTPVNHLVISQIRIAGSTDDFVELFNPTSNPISVNGHSVQYFAANSNFGFRVNLSSAKSVPAYGWYLVAGSGYSGSPTPDDSLGSSNASGTAGHLTIVQSTANTTCNAANVIDKAGYGATATCPETTSAATPGSGLSISRKPDDQYGNGTDTDVNSADFNAPAAPDIHNSSSTPATAPPSGSALGRVGVTVFLTPGASATSIEWGSTPGAASYNVYIGSTADFMTTPPSPVSVPANSLLDNTDPLANPATRCVYFKIFAFDGTNESEELEGE